jgi:macrolide-specific efflux system membrane fusion protein
MSEEIGPIALESDGGRTMFGQGVEDREYGEKTSALIDSEVSKIMSEAFSKAKQILNDKRNVLDAIANKTFTGKVLAIDTTGTSSSGVVSYPCILVFDDTPDGIYANMAVTAKIITNVIADALLVPNKAVTTNTSTGTSTVKILQNNQVQNQTVEVGINNDTQTQIISGISEGQSVITSTSSTNTTTSTNTSSPFGGVGIGGGGGQFRNLR